MLEYAKSDSPNQNSIEQVSGENQFIIINLLIVLTIFTAWSVSLPKVNLEA